MSEWSQRALMWFVESLRLGSKPSCPSNSIREPKLAPVPPMYLLRGGYKGPKGVPGQEARTLTTLCR